MIEKKLTFNVLMDNENRMTVGFGINSLPSKFILDKKGNIRFNDNVLEKRDDALVDSISMAIEILRAGE